MASHILTEFKQQVHDFKLIPSGGGCFELSLNGKLIYSKLETGKFPDGDEMIELVGSRVPSKAL